MSEKKKGIKWKNPFSERKPSSPTIYVDNDDVVVFFCDPSQLSSDRNRKAW